MSTVLIDRIAAVSFHNGILRIKCIAAGPNNEESTAATLLIPGSQAGTVLQSLVKATQELEKRLREQTDQK